MKLSLISFQIWSVKLLKDTDDYLLISGIEHFSFCRRQWALIHIEQLWNENILTAHGREIHSRVHENIADIRNGVLTLRGLRIKSDKYHITGVCDAVEFIPSEIGIELAGRKKLSKLAKECCNYGQRVQNSVFECVMDNAKYVEVKARLLTIIDKNQDSLRVYHLGNNYQNKIEHFGVKESID